MVAEDRLEDTGTVLEVERRFKELNKERRAYQLAHYRVKEGRWIGGMGCPSSPYDPKAPKFTTGCFVCPQRPDCTWRERF